MAKPKIDLRFNEELVHGATEGGRMLGVGMTGYMELAVAEKLVREKRRNVRPVIRALVERGERNLGLNGKGRT